MADDGLLQTLALPKDDLELLPAEVKGFRFDLRGQFLLLGLLLGLLGLGLGLEDRVEQGRRVAEKSSVLLGVAQVPSGLMAKKTEERETVEGWRFGHGGVSYQNCTD